MIQLLLYAATVLLTSIGGAIALAKELKALLSKGMNGKIRPHPSPSPEEEGTTDLAPFSLGRRAENEGSLQRLTFNWICLIGFVY